MSRLALTPTNVPASATAINTPTLRTGDLYYNTTTGLMVYSGSAWVQVSAKRLMKYHPSQANYLCLFVPPSKCCIERGL